MSLVVVGCCCSLLLLLLLLRALRVHALVSPARSNLLSQFFIFFPSVIFAAQVLTVTLRGELEREDRCWRRLLTANGTAAQRNTAIRMVAVLAEHLQPTPAALCARAVGKGIVRYQVSLLQDGSAFKLYRVNHPVSRKGRIAYDVVVRMERVPAAKRKDMLPVSCSCKKMT
jgi:hypothetical protein